ncbi:MAG: hypothetical protein EOO61_11685 [Hymenobacter sp.]|nr:MAG: hypothetical protein EOO61_11685 [Hymenobacter sp.]
MIIFNPDATRHSLETFTYTPNSEIRIDSNKMFIGGLPGDKIADKVFSYTIRIDKTDKYGNWIQRSFLFNKKYMLLSKREIEYH